VAVAAIAVALVAGCGGGGAATDAGTAADLADVSAFPSADGRTLLELRDEFDPEGPVLAPSVSVLEPGQRNRFGFGLFDVEMRQITDASVGVYVAPKGGGPAKGPYPARAQSLAVEPQFESQTTAQDPDSARVVYVADVPIGKPGDYEFLGAVELDGRLLAAEPASGPLSADPDNPVPDVGEPAPAIETPTYTSAGGDLEKIETRIPPARELLEHSFADVAGERPAVLLFATPQLCQSRVCGPVTDIQLQASADAPEEVAFIHQEIFRDNDPNQGVTDQVAEYDLESEPWLFVVDAEGRISARLEGAFSAAELSDAVSALAR
jgi:hypothetical protein